MLGFLSQQNTKCLTDKVQHDTNFVTYLKMSGRLESWRPLGRFLLSLFHINLEKLSRKISITTLVKLLGQLPRVQKILQRLMPRRDVIRHNGTHGHSTELWLALASATLWSHLLRLGQLHRVRKVPCGTEHPSALTARLQNLNASRKAKKSLQTCVLNPHIKAAV